MIYSIGLLQCRFFGSKIKWGEIDSLVYYPNGYIILRVDKRGFSFLNGLYFNDLMARRFRSQLPVIILSPGLEKKDELTLLRKVGVFSPYLVVSDTAKPPNMGVQGATLRCNTNITAQGYE